MILLVPGIVKDFNINSSNGTHLNITWTKPTGGENISNYVVEYKKPIDIDFTIQYVPHVVDDDRRFYSLLLSGLEPGGLYDIKVAANNTAGEGTAYIERYLTGK